MAVKPYIVLAQFNYMYVYTGTVFLLYHVIYFISPPDCTQPFAVDIFTDGEMGDVGLAGTHRGGLSNSTWISLATIAICLCMIVTLLRSCFKRINSRHTYRYISGNFPYFSFLFVSFRPLSHLYSSSMLKKLSQFNSKFVKITVDTFAGSYLSYAHILLDLNYYELATSTYLFTRLLLKVVSVS